MVIYKIKYTYFIYKKSKRRLSDNDENFKEHHCCDCLQKLMEYHTACNFNISNDSIQNICRQLKKADLEVA